VASGSRSQTHRDPPADLRTGEQRLSLKALKALREAP